MFNINTYQTHKSLISHSVCENSHWLDTDVVTGKINFSNNSEYFPLMLTMFQLFGSGYNKTTNIWHQWARLQLIKSFYG